MWELASPKPLEQASRLEIQVRVDDTVLNLNSTEQQSENSDRTLFLGQNNLFFGEPYTLLLSLSNYWMGLTYFMQDNLFYSKSTDLNVNYIFKKKKPSQ